MWIQQGSFQTQTIANFFTIPKITVKYTSHYTGGDVQSSNMQFVEKFGIWNPGVATTYSTDFTTLFRAAKPFLRSITWELLSFIEHF